jgi:hypothetical protein
MRDVTPALDILECYLDGLPLIWILRRMIRRLGLCLLASLLVLPARADKSLIAESRITPLEIRRKREKAAEMAALDGFAPLPRGPRIIGGDDASPGEYPWMAALVFADEPDNFLAQFCGGSLIHPRWILTASHCVDGTKAEDLEVLLGTNDLDSPSGFQRIAVAEIVMAPRYNDFNLDSDFALLRLAEPADPALTPLQLIDDVALSAPGVEAVLTGWGDLTNGGSDFPTLLQEVEIPLVDLAVANATPSYDGTLTENMLAAGFEAGGKDSCYGDSGGPLIVPSPVGNGWAQAGIVSFGAGCAEPGVYGIYSRVSQFRHWLLGHVMPNYAAWELANNRSGELRDPDSNGFTNFEDFALPFHTLTTSLTAETVRISYFRPKNASEVEYILESAPGPGGPWTVKSPTFVGFENGVGGLVNWIVELPIAENTGFFRVRAVPSTDLASGPRPLEFQTGTRGTIDATDAGFSRLYRLEGLPAGEPVSISLRSTDFDAELALEDAATGANLDTSASNSGAGLAGTDEILSFTPSGATEYAVRVTGGAGDFTLSVWAPGDLAGQTILSIPPLPKPATLKGSLAVGDAYDPLFLPGGEYLADNFGLDPSSVPAGQLTEVAMNSKGVGRSGIDDFLSLIDAESGKLVAFNDDRSRKSNNSVIRFVPVPGKSYLLRTSSSPENDTGNYTLSGRMPKVTPKTPVASLAVPATASGKLSGAGEMDESRGTAKRDYFLADLPAGTEVAVTMESTRLDAYIVVLDASDLDIVTTGDADGPPGGIHNARATFVTAPGHRYIVRATTWAPGEAGPYVLKTSTP